LRPAVIALPLGLWLLSSAGYPLVFAAGGLVALVGLTAVPGVPDRRPAEEPDAGGQLGMVAGLRSAALLRPSVLFAATTMAGGIVATFLPVSLPGDLHGFAAVALLVQAAVATLTRWWAGGHGDRHGSSGLLIPGVLVAATGMLVVAVPGGPVTVVVGVIAFGAGFGAVQNASLAVMYERVPRSAFGTVTAVWSIAYDAGWGLGAAGFGVLAAWSGYSIGFAITAAVMVVMLVAARQPRRRGRSG
jgi:predicted MFS family arabinose efflux permease